MKTLTKTIITIIVLSSLAGGIVSAKNASDEEIQAAKADVGVILAQAQMRQPAAPVPPTVPAPAPAPAPTPVQAVNQQLDSLMNSLSFGSRSGSNDLVLVIPAEQTSTEDLIAINEDMNVMSRIFEKNLEQDRIATARGGIFTSRRDVILPLLGGGRGEIQSMYLQGYGALFLLKVDFPLSPSSDVQEEEQEIQKAEEGDPVWRQMKQEMFEPEKVNRRRQSEKQQVKYDPEKVENLKTTLIRTLKHATNIRSLKPDELVILTVAGGGQSAGTKITAVNVAGNNRVIVEEKDAYGKRTMRIVNGTALDDIGLSSPTVLVIRVKKSEIDAFAKGELDFDKFLARVQMFTYPYLGGLEVRGDSLGLYYEERSSTEQG